MKHPEMRKELISNLYSLSKEFDIFCLTQYSKTIVKNDIKI